MKSNTATLTRIFPIPVGKKASDGRRTESLSLASGVLFLVNQPILIIWLMVVPRAVARTQAAQRDIAWIVIFRGKERNDARTSHCRGVSRSSTWSRRPVSSNPHRQYLRRRGRSDSLDALDLQSPLCGSHADSDSDGSGPIDDWDGQCTAAATALGNPLSPRC